MPRDWDPEGKNAAMTGTAAIQGMPSAVARMLAVEILLTDPEALEDDVFESCLYLYREKLRAA
jgi:hypothetical protein